MAGWWTRRPSTLFLHVVYYDLQAVKIDMTVSPPLIVRLGGRDYSAYLHSDHGSDPLSLTDSRTDQVTIGPQDNGLAAEAVTTTLTLSGRDHLSTVPA